MSNWIKENEIVLVSGLAPGAILALASLAFVYSPWVPLAVFVCSFIGVYTFVLLVDSIK